MAHFAVIKTPTFLNKIKIITSLRTSDCNWSANIIWVIF